jgi:MFS family permease
MRDIGFLLASMVLSSVPIGYLLVVLPLYLSRIGLEPALIGLLYSLSGLVTAGLVAGSGALADRFGRRRFLIVGTALPICSYTIFAVTTSPVWLVIASLIGGVGLANGAAGALTAASFDALLAEHSPIRQRTRVFALAQALWSLALGGGSIAAGLPRWLQQMRPDLSTLDAYRPPFLGLIVLTAIATLLLQPTHETGWSSTASSPTAGWLPRRSAGVIVRYALAIGLFGLGLGVAVQLLPLWFNLRFGADEGTLGPWYAAAQILSLASVVVAPWLDRRLGGGLAVLLVQLLGGACLLGIALLAPVFEIAALGFVVRNVLANLAWPLQQSLLMTTVVREERATAAGVGFSVWGLTNAIGPVLAGLMIQNGSLSLPLVLGSVAYMLGGLAFGFGFQRHSVLASSTASGAKSTGEIRLKP